MSLNKPNDTTIPLAQRMRPSSLAEFVGQSHLLAKGKPLFQALAQGRLHSMILWGTPGTGKTTLAELIAQAAKARIERLSAVLAGVKDIRAVIERAQSERHPPDKVVLFIDEVHRFNKAQQDALLPHVEQGVVTLIGATTENPSFAVNNALLSRTRVYRLAPLDSADLVFVIERALHAHAVTMPVSLQTQLAVHADGDARACLNLLEVCFDLLEVGERDIKPAVVAAAMSHSVRRFDAGGDHFYDQISALHKSVRGSDPNAALYWFSRMVDGGCDRPYLARRLVRMASEDIGNADPRALSIALDAWNAFERLGSPEGDLMLAQAVLYLASAPKSNAVYRAYNLARDTVCRGGSLEVPLHLRHAPAPSSHNGGSGCTYRYAHDEPGAFAAGQRYFPEGMPQVPFYQPVDRGLEIKIKEKLSGLQQLNQQADKRDD